MSFRRRAQKNSRRCTKSKGPEVPAAKVRPTFAPALSVHSYTQELEHSDAAGPERWTALKKGRQLRRPHSLQVCAPHLHSNMRMDFPLRESKIVRTRLGWALQRGHLRSSWVFVVARSDMGRTLVEATLGQSPKLSLTKTAHQTNEERVMEQTGARINSLSARIRRVV